MAHYRDLNMQLRRLSNPGQRHKDEQMIFARLQHGKISVGEAVQKLLPHVGTKSKAALAVVCIAGLVERPLTPDALVNEMQNLVIAQHGAVSQHDALHRTDPGPVPNVSIRDVRHWVDSLKIASHIEVVAGKLHPRVL